MRKLFLSIAGFLILTLNGFSQAYTYYPYGGSSASAYAVPDATCDQLYEIENFKNKGYSSSFAGIPGRELIQFDQVSADAGGSTYAAEYGFTCGASPVGTTSSYSNFRTEWGTGTYDNKVGKWNVNPETLEGTVGAYFWHTVNFTQTGDYKFLFRIRGNGTAATAIATNSTVEVTLYAKSNVSTPLATKTIIINGLKYNKNTNSTYDTGLIGNTSTDGSAEYAADGDFTIAINQSRPEWVRGTSAFNIASAGEYVVKISQTVGANTGGIGGFTFQKVATAPTLYVNSPLTGFLTVAGAESNSKILNLAGDLLTGTGDFTVTGSTNFEVSTDNISFSGSITVPVASVNTTAGFNVYVRVKASASAGALDENITVSADGGTSGANVQCTGTVNTPSFYTWNGSVSTDWQVADNWTPTRTTPQITDAIIFDGTTSSVTNIPSSQTIGQLKLINNAVVTLNNNTASTGVTLSLSGGAGADFTVEAGSHLKLNSNVAAATVNITLNTGATGSIAGQISVMCDETVTGSNHRINSKIDALHFVNGSTFHAATGFNGYPFGTNSNPNGSVIFESGSTYRHSSGDQPFGGTNTTNVATFETGSYYLYDGVFGGIIIKPGVGGKTYNGTFEVNTSNAGVNSNPAADVIYNIVKVNGTSWAIGGNTNNAVTYIKGNVTVGTGGKFRFGLNPGIVSPVTFNGTSPQTVLLEDNGEFNNGSGSVMTIDNDVTFDGNVLINGTLNISTGKTLAVATAKTLTLPSTAVVNNLGTLNNSGIILNLGTITGAATGTGLLVNVSANDNVMGSVTGVIADSAVSLTAVAKIGYQFINWTEEPTGIIGTDAVLPTFKANANRNIVANFGLVTSLKNIQSDVFATVSDKNIVLKGEISAVEIFNVQGKLVYKNKQSVTTVPMTTIGVFIVKMHTSSGVKVQKVNVF